MEGHHSAVWDYRYPWQDRCLRALHVGPCSNRASMGPPAVCLHCTDSHIWGVKPRFLPSANLSEEPKCSSHCGPSQNHCGNIAPVNQVPPVTLLMGTSGESAFGPQKDWILDELNLQHLEDWPEAEQKQARELLTRRQCLFTCSNLDLGKMSLKRHQIKLTEWIPFKQHYWQIPPHMYNDVKAHLQEMLDIDAIQ